MFTASPHLQVTSILLGRISKDPPRMSYVYDSYMFRYVHSGNLLYARPSH